MKEAKLRLDHSFTYARIVPTALAGQVSSKEIAAPMKGSMAMYAMVGVALMSSLASGVTPLPSPAPTYIATRAPTHPTLSPSAFPTNPTAKPTAVPTHPTPKPTSLGSSPSLAVPTTPAPTTPAPTRTNFPTPTPKPVATGKSAAPSAPTPKPTPTALFQQSVGPYKVAYKVSQRFAASNFGQYEQLLAAASAADNKGWPYFKHWLRNAVLEALPKIGQVQLPNGDWDDKGRYLIDLTASYFAGPILPLSVVTAQGTGVQYLPTIALNYTVEFNGLYMSTIEYDGGQTLVSSGKVSRRRSPSSLPPIRPFDRLFRSLTSPHVSSPTSPNRTSTPRTPTHSPSRSSSQTSTPQLEVALASSKTP